MTPAEQLNSLDPVLVLEWAQDCVYLVDRNWRFTFLNTRAHQEISGGRELIGEELWQSLPELAETPFATALREAMAMRRPTEVEAFVPGRQAWFSTHIYPAGEGLAVFFRNVSTQHLRQAALRESEKKFRAMFETFTVGILFRDRNGAVIDCNPAAARILGLTVDELCLPNPRVAFVDGEGKELAPDEFPLALALRTGRTMRGFVLGFRHPQLNELRWLRIDAIPQFQPGETTPYQVYALFSDITDQRNAEEALRASRAHLAAAQRVASVGSVAIDFRTGKWQWSDETYRIYGRDRETYTPRAESLVELVHPEDREKYLASIECSKWGIDPPPLEFRIVRPNGEVRTIYREVELIRDETGCVVGGIATKQDVTEVRAAERRRQDLERQLLHAQRMDALGTLAGGIAHDLNNILVPVIGLTEYLQSGLPADHRDRAVLDVIRQAGQRARDLVDQILAFSRRENPDRHKVDLSALLRESMRLVRATVPATIRIVEEFDEVAPVYGDPGQLHQVLLNLTANATHAIGHGIGTITITVTQNRPLPGTPTANEWICLSVADTGCGMDEAIQKRVFEPFFTTKSAGEGTGLGLSVVHGIITSHGGSIEIESAPGRGTRVSIYLPAASASPAPSTLEAAE